MLFGFINLFQRLRLDFDGDWRHRKGIAFFKYSLQTDHASKLQL